MPLITNDDIVGVIIAGGLSSRMHGIEKSLLKLGKISLIERVIQRLKPQMNQILINTNGNSDRFSNMNLPVQADTITGSYGPLAGILAGMHWCQNHQKNTTL